MSLRFLISQQPTAINEMDLAMMSGMALPHWMLAALLPGIAELVVVVVLIIVLFGLKKVPGLGRGFSRGWNEFKKAGRQVREEMESDTEGARAARKAAREHTLAVWFAQGFGVGRIAYAPGTFGTLAGLLWFVLLVATGSLRVFIDGILLGVALSVWLCGKAERDLAQTDPPSVVLDEIAAFPICFVPWVVSEWVRLDAMPSVGTFFSSRTWWFTVLVFGLFRAFDILKPWPIRASQRLPGGWGVTADDVLAAVGVALLTLLFIS